MNTLGEPGTPREIRGHVIADIWQVGDCHLRGTPHEKAVLVIGDVEQLDQIEEIRSMHRLLFRRLRPAQLAWQKETGKTCLPDFGELVEWVLSKCSKVAEEAKHG